MYTQRKKPLLYAGLMGDPSSFAIQFFTGNENIIALVGVASHVMRKFGLPKNTICWQARGW